MFGRRCPLATGTDGIEPLGIKGEWRFQANVTLPLGEEMVNVAESFALMKAKCVEPDVPSVGAVATEVLAKDVESMPMFVAPLEDDLNHAVELSQRRVASDQKATPDEWTNASQDDTQLIDVGVCLV